MRRTRSSRFLALGVVAAILLSACGATPAAAPTGSAAATASAAPTTAVATAIDRVKQKGLYIGVFSSAPLSFLEGQNWVGSEADITRQCASEKFGLTTEQIFPIFLPLAGLLPGLQAQRFDMAAGLTVNPTRLQVAIATQHGHTWGARPIFKRGDALATTIHSWTDMSKAGVELGLAAGVQEITTAQQKNIPVRTYATLDLAVKDLQAGRIRMVLHGDLAIPGVIAQTNNEIVAAEPFDYEGIQSGAAFWFNPNEKDLRDSFNDCISSLKTSGKMREILTKWNQPLNIPPAGPGSP
jgi:polar amino acid transport system substrate-binding protein